VVSIQEAVRAKGEDGWELLHLGPGEGLGLRPLETGGGTTLAVPALLVTFKRPAPLVKS